MKGIVVILQHENGARWETKMDETISYHVGLFSKVWFEHINYQETVCKL
jgi:hypothetical protein